MASSAGESDRRYSDDEIVEIFSRAAEQESTEITRPSSAPSATGLTLRELESVAEEVGLPAERVREAALALDTPGSAPRRMSYLGFPVAVRHTVPLDRQLTDREWSILVGELREMFAAQGKVATEADTRSWRNGNLHVYVEPTRDGYRLRMGTRKSNALAVGLGGLALLVLAFFLFMTMLLSGESVFNLIPVFIFTGIGCGIIGTRVLTLGDWGREREGQMIEIAKRTRELVAEAPDHGAAEEI